MWHLNLRELCSVMTSDRHCPSCHLPRCKASCLVLALLWKHLLRCLFSYQPPVVSPLTLFLYPVSKTPLAPSAPQHHFYSLLWAGQFGCPPGPLRAMRSSTASGLLFTVTLLLQVWHCWVTWHCWVSTRPAAVATNTEAPVRHWIKIHLIKPVSSYHGSSSDLTLLEENLNQDFSPTKLLLSHRPLWIHRLLYTSSCYLA